MATARVRFRAPDRRLQILEVATRLFARQGFSGTTTRQIADAAAVNEALIFRHFPSKEELYWAVIDEKTRSSATTAQMRARLDSNATDRQVFAAIAEDLLRARRQDSTITRLMLYSALEDHGLADRFFRTRVAQYYELLAEHIRKRTAAGAFRKVDPVLAARGFLGMIVYHFLVQELFGGKTYKEYDDRQVSEVLADIWLQGMVSHPSHNGNGHHNGHKKNGKKR